MIYTIILWMLIVMTSIWIFPRFYVTFKKTDQLLLMNKSHQLIRSWATRNHTMTSLFVIISWWMSFMFVEALKITFIDSPKMNYHLIAVILIPLVMIATYFFMNSNTTRKYHIRICEICTHLEQTVYIMIAFLYALIVSYGIEAITLISA